MKVLEGFSCSGNKFQQDLIFTVMFVDGSGDLAVNDGTWKADKWIFCEYLQKLKLIKVNKFDVHKIIKNELFFYGVAQEQFSINLTS